ncbi:MAG: epimerase [Acidimicrobiia bacterium]|nr:epimerase [Acidimicrobiia bacterium]
MRALVVGGTGPTGPFIVDGLRQRGYEVAIFHRGTHEIPEIGPDIEHVHGDPHFPETIRDALGERTFDLVVATYGRLRHLAEHFVGRVGRLVSVGGFPVYKGFWDPYELHPPGMFVPVAEDGPTAGPDDNRFSHLIRSTEEAVLSSHPAATHFRYPYVYGPYQVAPVEWSVVRRILDRRPFVIVSDGGHALYTRGFAQNMAHAVLAAVDQPDRCAGQVYNCGDEVQYSVRQWVELIAEAMGTPIEVLSLPHELAAAGDPLLVDGGGFHRLLDLQKLRVDLGYHDVVPVRDAVERAVRWLVEHRPEPGGDVEERVGDAFDYDAEDRLAAAWGRALDGVRPLAPARAGDGYRPHAYAHPAAPGQASDHRNR